MYSANIILKTVNAMKRKFVEKLVLWKENSGRKPLMVIGVRQCGKTYIINEFGKENYEEVAGLNFERQEKLSEIFESDFDTKRILFELSVLWGKTIHPGKTLIFFDEIQACPKAITSLKYFCEDAPGYHIVCAGSLLGIKIHSDASFPVGKVEMLNMYPMSFSEFVRAGGEEMLADLLDDYSGGKKIPDAASDKLETLLREYYIVGGMPEAVKTWVETRDIEKVEAIQQNILDGYGFDFAKHAPIKDFPKLTAIWESIPIQLAKENNKFVFGNVKKGWRAKVLEDALEWLSSAGLVYKVSLVEKPFIPLKSYEKTTSFKLYMCDIGLLRKMADVPASVILAGSPYYTEFKGAMTENYVLGELVKGGIGTAYYWNSGNTAEVDFIIQCGKYIVPIEVKSEKNVKSRSLAEYRRRYEPEYAVKTSMKPETSGKEVLNVPLWVVGKIDEIIKSK